MSQDFKFNYFSFYSLIFLINLNIIYSLISNKQSDEYLGSTGKHLFHFVQVTDTHLTHLNYPDRTEQFEQFCNQIIKKIVRPKVTIVSGDLVDNVEGLSIPNGRMIVTGQIEKDWKIYGDILNRTNITKYTKWLDLRGNHDVFMDAYPDALSSFYRIYSNQGRTYSGSYKYTLRTDDGDSYSFIAVDLSRKPGPGAPFNLIGYLNNRERKILTELSEQTKNSTSIIFFGHYPLSFTYSYKIHKIMKYGIVYLNGHLHYGIKNLYARHSNGLLELELGDWKRNRRFRILTIDSGLLSFEDFRFNQSIYAVISNPKPAKFYTPREPFYRLSQSTYIRILIFSNSSIVNVNISIDGQYIGSAVQSIDNTNLFIFPWNASIYNDEKLHEILVEIKDKENNTMNLKHEFSLSLSIVTNLNGPRKFVLTFHQPTFNFIIFFLPIFGYIFILLYYRYQAKHKRFNITNNFTLRNRFSQKMTLLCSVDVMFYPLIGLALYHFVGPWYIGYLTEGHIGVIFLFGAIIEGVYLPPDSQVIAGTIQLYLFIFPLTFTLSSSCFYRYNQTKSQFNRCIRIYTVYVLFFYTLFIILLLSFLITASYKFGWILSPFCLMLIIFTIILYIKSHRLKSKDFKLKISTKPNEIIKSINEDNSKLLNNNDHQQIDLHFIKSE